MSETPETPDELDAQALANQPESPDDVADFDQFWTMQDRKGHPVKIMGMAFTLPPALPLQFELEAKRLNRSKSDEDVRKLCALLFGEGTVDELAKRGMDGEQFAVLLLWSTAKVSGANMTMAEALQAYREQDKTALDPTKPPRRQQRKSSGSSSKRAGR